MSILVPQLRIPTLSPQAGLSQVVQVLPMKEFVVVDGVNEGDFLGSVDDVSLDDIYHLSRHAAPSGLAIHVCCNETLCIGDGSEIGTPGTKLNLDAVLTFICANGKTTEVLVIAEQGPTGRQDGLHLLPLGPLVPKTDYTLVGIEREVPSQRLAISSNAFFGRGTRITTMSGCQTPVEHLWVGDKVMTRTHGLQPIKWIDHVTVRAVGQYAPIRIAPNALNNTAELVISRQQKLEVHNINGAPGDGARSGMAKADQLVNGVDVTAEEGGFVDYFHLFFEDPQIIFAEGLAAEASVFDASAPVPTSFHGPVDLHASRRLKLTAAAGSPINT